jgi:hypothetical protein
VTLPRAVGLLYESLNDLDLALAGLSDGQVIERRNGGSSFAWTAAHVTQMFESWILHQFMRHPRHPLFADPNFGAGGSGATAGWPTIRAAIGEVRATARPFLDAVTADYLTRTVPYTGSVAILQGHDLNLEYAIMRIAAHHFVHASEIATVRSILGTPIEDNRDWGTLFL